MQTALKKTLSLLATAALFFCCAAAAGAAPDENVNRDVLYSSNGEENIYITQDKFLYNFNGEEPGVTICGYAGDLHELSFPNLINGREVSAIDKGSFENDDRILSVSFPNSIKSIGENSFNGCKNLTTVNLASGVNQFRKVFCDCPAITSITFPNGVGSISESFRRCKKLSYIKFARSVTKIDDRSFSDCTSLRKIEWIGRMVNLGNAFDGCTALETVAIPDGVILINGAFDGCTSLQKITFPQTLLYITGGFSDCPSLTEVDLPEKLLFVNDSFNHCENLSRVKTGDATKISDNAFMNCPHLVIEKGNDTLWQVLGGLALTALMLLTGILVYRRLTAMSGSDGRKRKKAPKHTKARKTGRRSERNRQGKPSEK